MSTNDGDQFESVKKRVLNSFRGEKVDEAKEYSDKVYAAWRDTSASLSRTALLIFLLMAVFELLAYQSAATVVSIGAFTFANSSLVQILLPTIVAFVVYDGYRLSARWLRLEEAYITLTGIYAQTQRENSLDLLIEPNLPSMWGIGTFGIGRVGNKNADKVMLRVNQTMSRLMMFAVPVAFEIQAYYRLIQKFGFHDALIWVSIGITTILALLVGAYVWFGNLLESIT